MTIRLPRVAAEMTVAALSNRKLRQPPLLFLSFDAWKLRANQRPVNGSFFQLGLGRRFVRFAAVGCGNDFFDVAFDDWIGGRFNGSRHFNRRRDNLGRLIVVFV